MRSLRSSLLAALLALAPACREVDVPEGTVAARATALGIVATNSTELPAGYFAYSPDWLAAANLAAPLPGADPCPCIPAHGSLTIPWVAVNGYSPDRHDYSLSWRLVGDSVRQGNITGLRH